uniref:Uncharacterized protein n=1 Tax=Loa loa TaxID=7209 RepID=A0A1I7W302_LOALO
MTISIRTKRGNHRPNEAQYRRTNRPVEKHLSKMIWRSGRSSSWSRGKALGSDL